MSSVEFLVSKMYEERSKKENIIKYTEKINMDFEKEIVNVNSNGYVLFDFVSKKIVNKETFNQERYFISLRLITIENNLILEN